MRNWTAIFCLLIIFVSCQKSRKFEVRMDAEDIGSDSLVILESISGRKLGALTASLPKIVTETLIGNQNTGQVTTEGSEVNTLIALIPGRKVDLERTSNGLIVSPFLVDSLLNMLWFTTNQFIAENSGFIFNDQMAPDSLALLFETFRQIRAKEIQKHRENLSTEEIQLLEFQNDARIYSFLFYYGRIIRELEVHHSFFDFAEQIQEFSFINVSLPHNVLYKFELEYLRLNDTLTSIADFISFIDKRNLPESLGDFYKAIYIKELIESPSYWEKHFKLFDREALDNTVKRESGNRFFELFGKPHSGYLSTQTGMPAGDFTAVNAMGDTVKLSDFSGKVVFIDVWATWCGPCMQQREHIIGLYKEFEHDQQAAVLMVSTDRNVERWKQVISKNNSAPLRFDLIIPQEHLEAFRENFQITYLPKYMLIDHKGNFISSTIQEPSEQVSAMIARAKSLM